jgi:hypothetical protein
VQTPPGGNLFRGQGCSWPGTQSDIVFTAWENWASPGLGLPTLTGVRIARKRFLVKSSNAVFGNTAFQRLQKGKLLGVVMLLSAPQTDAGLADLCTQGVCCVRGSVAIFFQVACSVSAFCCPIFGCWNSCETCPAREGGQERHIWYLLYCGFLGYPAVGSPIFSLGQTPPGEGFGSLLHLSAWFIRGGLLHWVAIIFCHDVTPGVFSSLFSTLSCVFWAVPGQQRQRKLCYVPHSWKAIKMHDRFMKIRAASEFYGVRSLYKLRFLFKKTNNKLSLWQIWQQHFSKSAQLTPQSPSEPHKRAAGVQNLRLPHKSTLDRRPSTPAFVPYFCPRSCSGIISSAASPKSLCPCKTSRIPALANFQWV